METFLQADNLLSLNAKHIIFDFDETLYYSETLQDDYLNFIKKAVMDLTAKPQQEVEHLMQQFGFVKGNQHRPRMRDTIEKFGAKMSAWDEYRVKNFFLPNVENIHIVSNDLLLRFCKQFDCSIVSTELTENIFYKAKVFGIDLSAFKNVFGSTSYDLNTEKIVTYQKIINDNNLMPKEVLVIGDRFHVDIKPLLDLGGNGVLIKTTHDVEKVLSELLNN